jgi:hypothetical protein
METDDIRGHYDEEFYEAEVYNVPPRVGRQLTDSMWDANALLLIVLKATADLAPPSNAALPEDLPDTYDAAFDKSQYGTKMQSQ